MAVLSLFACSTPTAQAPALASIPSASTATQVFYEQFAKHSALPEISALGKTLFADPALSASGKVSCASCHKPVEAYGSGTNLAAQKIGENLTASGLRATPSLRYLVNVPSFTEHYHGGEDDSVDQGPVGGHTWDGRANSVHAQAALPLFSPTEMANRDANDVVAKVRQAGYAKRFQAVFGEDIFKNTDNAFNAILFALEVFQQNPTEFYPYTSKYDAYLRGQVRLSDTESKGLAAFNDPNKGNCANCHPSTVNNGAFPQFSDWGFIALGVPRNTAISANADSSFFDLGLCGPVRQDFVKRAEYCGLFRTPSLRNVATRQRFFHNAAFDSLEKVLEFYAERETHPEKWYPKNPDGSIKKYNDLPVTYHGNINADAPFNRQPGQAPTLTPTEIGDIVAFLKTLSDGCVP